MIRIAIVDDDDTSYALIKKYLQKFSDENSVVFDIRYFKDPLFFLEDYTSSDIVLLDIEMPYMNGIEAAQKLREIDPTVALIFITNYVQYAIKGYSVNAIDYVLKPINYTRFSALMSKTVKLIDRDKNADIALHTTAGMRKIPVYSIIYIEVTDHLLIYCTENGNFEVWGTLKEAEKTLPGECFVRCNHSVIVNLKYVYSMEKNIIRLSKVNREIAVSHNKKQEFISRLTRFIK